MRCVRRRCHRKLVERTCSLRVLHCLPPCRAVNITKARLEGLFVDELERFQPTLGYMRLLKESVRRVWHDRKASVKNEVASAEHRAKAIQQKLGRLDDAFIYKESIDLGTYERQRDRLREELTLVESDRHGSKVEEFDVEAILNFAERVLPRASDLWIQASLEQGQRLQRLFFRKAWPSYLHGHSGISRASSRHSGVKERLPESGADLWADGSDRLLGPTARLAGPWQSPPDARARGYRWSAGGDHAAASMEEHVPQVADRLASARTRRAAAARDVRSTRTASPVPKYISSGVCPQNAEWGSTWLCSWT